MLSIRTRLQSVYLIAFCFIMLTYACKKSEQHSVDPTKDKEKPGPGTVAVQVPSSINSELLRIEFNYEGETNRLMEISQSDGKLTKFFYRPDGLPLKQEHYKDKKLQQEINYLIDKAGQIYKIYLFDSKSAPIGYYAISYDDEKRISALKKHGPNNLLQEEETISYDHLGNAVSISIVNTSKTTKMTGIYDDKLSIYRNIPYVQLLLFNQDQARISFSKSNPLGIDYSSPGSTGSIYTYEYNSDNYPTSFKRKHGTITETTKLTYKAIKPK